jgi:hypothetical protein
MASSPIDSRVAVLRPRSNFYCNRSPRASTASACGDRRDGREFRDARLGYAEARDEIARDRLASGISIGVVMGADGRKPSLVESYFWENSAETNVADEEAGRIAQNAYNLGIVTGYRQALELNQDQKATFWRDIGDLVGDTSYLGDSKSWDDRAGIDWHATAGAKFRGAHLE